MWSLWKIKNRWVRTPIAWVAIPVTLILWALLVAFLYAAHMAIAVTESAKQFAKYDWPGVSPRREDVESWLRLITFRDGA